MTCAQLGGRKATPRSKNPALQFDLSTRPGDANIKSVAVTLPKAFAIDQRHLGNICSRAQLAAEHCAGRQPIGTAMTTTPLLDQPLKGPAYAVSGFGKLPHVVFILGGQVTLMPEAESSSVNGRPEDHRPGRPRRPDRPLPPRPLRRASRLPRQHAESLQLAGGLEDRATRARTAGRSRGGSRPRPPAKKRKGRESTRTAGAAAAELRPGSQR